MGAFSLFMAAPISVAPISDPGTPFVPPIDPTSGGTLSSIYSTIGSIFSGGQGPISVPIASGFGPVQTPTSPVTVMPTPISASNSKCLLGHGHRRMNWANFRALNRANRRLHAFNHHARKYIKITRKVRAPKRRKRR